MIKKILAGIGAMTLIAVLFLSLTAATSPVSSLTKITSRDGITVYHYGSCVIVKTNNAISITR